MSSQNPRRDWMSLLAKAPADWLDRLWKDMKVKPPHSVLRSPEIGGVMVRGRMGAVGAPFNLGEMTVTRCSLQLDAGPVGHGYVQGRDKTHATQAALIDALMQTEAADRVRAGVLEPLAARMAEARARRVAKAAGTRVEFFTLVRGED